MILVVVSVVFWLVAALVTFVVAPWLIERAFPDREAERLLAQQAARLAKYRRADYERMLRETAEVERELGIEQPPPTDAESPPRFSSMRGGTWGWHAFRDQRKVDYDRLNRKEFELGFPFSSRPEPWHPPDVGGRPGYYNVSCRDCGYTSTGHPTEADAQERADSHHHEHTTGEVADEPSPTVPAAVDIRVMGRRCPLCGMPADVMRTSPPRIMTRWGCSCSTATRGHHDAD